MLAKEKIKMNARDSDCLKNEPPGRNLGITLKMNKWALLERNSMQQNDSYNIP
jgi:hypothetical protein